MQWYIAGSSMSAVKKLFFFLPVVESPLRGPANLVARSPVLLNDLASPNLRMIKSTLYQLCRRHFRRIFNHKLTSLLGKQLVSH